MMSCLQRIIPLVVLLGTQIAILTPPVVVNGSIVSLTKDVFQRDKEEKDPEYNGDRTSSEIQHYVRGRHPRVGRIRYHYDDSFRDASESRRCTHIIIVGVGTAMTVDQYDGIAEHIVTNSSTVYITSNHNMNGIVKASAIQFADLINAIYEQLEVLVPICSSTANTSYVANDGNHILPRISSTKAKLFIVGGHSSSGQAAFEAVQKDLLQFHPFALLGLDPYQISPPHGTAPLLPLPSLFWGFTTTTCFVHVESAARGAYQQSSPEFGRVLYAIDNRPDTIRSHMTHCVFTDHGCGAASIIVCPTQSSFDWVYDSVAQSVRQFIGALDSEEPFRSELFELPRTTSGDIALHVNDDILSADDDKAATEQESTMQWL